MLVTQWGKVKLGDTGRIVTGRTPRAANPQHFGQLHPFLTPSDMKFMKRDVITDRRLSNLGAVALNRIALPSGSPCFVCIGATIGKACLATETTFTNQQINGIVVDPKVSDGRFLYYAVGHNPESLKLQAGGAATPILNKTAFSNIEIALPPLSIQKRIAGILSAYDDLIENNTRRIAILEEMARRTYEEWFVKYRFPGGNGTLPDNWTLGILDDIVVLQRGFDLPKRLRVAGKVPIISASGTSGTHHSAKVERQGIVTGRSGTLGKVMLVHEPHWPLNTVLWGKIFPTSSILFAFYTLSKIHLSEYNSGAAVPTLNRNDIKNLPHFIPTNPLLEKFEEVVEPMINLARKLELSNSNLCAQRDLLIPRLISGEIDVSSAEQELEAAE